eukprot:TRINITY_DN13441_c0_g2_i1.p1 TRINITY_DN13441_c0_g2~~TRINITY_DN13441_c0_g2_i1.p1  ORF type:complete len:101 (+),score=5.17 TRINITY_DN13441_c0_g2_i1:141-443(+)
MLRPNFIVKLLGALAATQDDRRVPGNLPLVKPHIAAHTFRAELQKMVLKTALPRLTHHKPRPPKFQLPPQRLHFEALNSLIARANFNACFGLKLICTSNT